MRSADDYFVNRAPGWSPETPGEEIDGTIVERDVTQQREYVKDEVGELLWWVNRKPKALPEAAARAQGLTEDDAVTQLVLTLQTSMRDPKIDDDDGQRRVYIKGRRFDTAIRDALKRAGAKKLAEGGRLRVRFTDWDPESQNPKNPAKMYVAKYEPPAAPADDYFSGQDAPPEDPWAGQESRAPAGHIDEGRSSAPAADPVASETSPIETVPDAVWAGMDTATRRALVNLQRERFAPAPS